MDNGGGVWAREGHTGGIRARIAAAVDVFKQGYPRIRTATSVPQKQTGSGMLQWPTDDTTPLWHLVNFETYVEEGVNLNAVVYSALRYKWQATYTAPLRAYHGDPEQPKLLPPSDPLAQLLKRPNPWQDWGSLQAQADAFLNIVGNAYFWKFREEGGQPGVPSAVYCPRPDKIFIIPTFEDGVPSILGYYYVPDGKPWGDGIPILPTDMMHVKLFNPMDPLDGLGEGLSPLSSAAYSIDVDNSVTRFLKLFFDRGGVPPYFFTFDMPMDDTTISQLQTRIQEMYGGGDNWIKPGVLGAGGKIERVGMTFTEMGFSDLDERNESRILGPLGVPPILIGTRFGLKRATYANSKEARQQFWEDVFKPELMLFEDVFQNHLYTDQGGFVAHDYTSVPAFQKDLPKLADAAWKLWSMGVPAETAFATVGIPVSIDNVPDSDVGYIPLNVYPVGEERILNQPSGGEEEIEEEGGESEEEVGDPAEEASTALFPWLAANFKPLLTKDGLTERAKEGIGVHYTAIAQNWQKKMGDAAFRQFAKDYEALLVALRAGGTRKEKGVQWDEVSLGWNKVLDEAEGEWQSTFAPYMQGVIEDQNGMYSAAFGLSFDVRLLYAETWFDDYTMKFAADVIDAHERELAALLKTAQAEGWSVPMMESALADTFNAWMTGELPTQVEAWIGERQTQYRRMLIARTEAIRSSAAGINKLFEQWGVEIKEWHATKGDRTCDWCRSMDGTKIPTGESYFEQGQKFSVSVSGQQRTMTFNYGPIPHPPLHPLCRCALLPYKESWSSFGI
jgi:HK97 family phage portal protein